MTQTIMQQLTEAQHFIQARTALRPRIGIVLGSGLGAFGELFQDATTISYADIPHFAPSNVVGHAGKLMLGTLHNVPCAVLSGRVHYYEGHSIEDVVFPIRLLACLGVQTLVVTNAAGGVNAQFEPGTLMAITDHINFTGQNPLRGPNLENFGPRFPDMSQAYSLDGLKQMHNVAQQLKISLQQGVYVGVTGPSYETPAEIRMFQRWGADAVGMSTVAEVIAARHAQLQILGLSVITNCAAGLSAEPLSHQEVTDVANRVKSQLCLFLENLIQVI